MRVRPEYWRRGYGQEMLSVLELWAAGLGYSTLHLDTTVGQTAARRLYEENGFRKVGRARLGGFECVFYEKGLEAASPEVARRYMKSAPRPCYISSLDASFGGDGGDPDLREILKSQGYGSA